MSKIHHITFATGVSRTTELPYSDTQTMLVNSIQSQTKREVISYTHNLETMKNQSWFHKIEHLPQIEMGESNWWSRDGYFCAYKALFANDLLDKIDPLIESYQGEYGIQNITIPGSSTPSNMISYLEEQCTLINKYYSSFKESYLQNQLDTIMELIYSTIYKLKNLK